MLRLFPILLPAAACAALALAAALQNPAAAAETPPTARLLRHVVLFKFKDTATPADVTRIIEAFRALPGKIDAIKGFEWGTDVSPEDKSQGLTHCFVVTFADEAGRDAYLPHPAHKAFVALVGPHVDKVCVVDFWAQPGH